MPRPLLSLCPPTNSSAQSRYGLHIDGYLDPFDIPLHFNYDSLNTTNLDIYWKGGQRFKENK